MCACMCACVRACVRVFSRARDAAVCVLRMRVVIVARTYDNGSYAHKRLTLIHTHTSPNTHTHTHLGGWCGPRGIYLHRSQRRQDDCPQRRRGTRPNVRVACKQRFLQQAQVHVCGGANTRWSQSFAGQRCRQCGKRTIGLVVSRPHTHTHTHTL